MELTNYLKIYPCTDKPARVLALATRRCAVLELSENLLEAARSGALVAKDRDTLVRLGVLVPDRAAEREEMRQTFATINNKNRHFNALATLTLECNLGCGYCFEDPFRGRFAMTDHTAELLIGRLKEQMAAGRDVTVVFYGGEALMALGLLKRIAGRLSDAALEAGVTFAFRIITNATLLTRPVVQELLPLGLASVMTTLDGPKAIHDQQRPFVSGKGSFDTIVANLKAVYDLVPVDLGGNYTRDNYQRFPEMLDYLISEGIPPGALKEVGFAPVVPKADGSVSGDLNSACASVNEPWAIEASLFLRQETIKRGFPVSKLKAGACMIEFEHDLVVGYDGFLYKCPAFMGREELRVGSLADGVGDYSASHNLDLWKNDECLDCAYLPLCFGGCRFLRLLESGAMDGVDCRRPYLDAALERLVRQDLSMKKPVA